MMRPSVLDLFSGACGGWSLGLHRAGFETIAACESVEWRRNVFSHNFPNARMYDDVRTLTAERLRADLGRTPDIIVGSPPCQDASAANQKGRGVDGERTGLFFEAIRIVGECRPRWCAFENSPFIRTRGADKIIGAMEALGYACWPFVVGADHVGAPHERKRVWIICSDAHGDRLRVEPGWGGGSHREGASVSAPDDRDSTLEQEGGTGLPWADDWHSWHGGLARHLRVADGVPASVASQLRSAYGDAVLPQITESIGRSILRTERALAAVYGAAA